MKISTSILNSNNRIDSVVKLNRTNTSYIHVDVMDGKFVKDTQLNKINEISSLNIVSKYKLDIHLMVENPINYIKELSNMNIEYITFHIEVDKDINKIISTIKDLNYKVGLAIKPNTDINKLKPYLDKIDLILIMSVEPGKGGQKFLDTTPNRIKQIKELIKDKNILIEVDGGINEETIQYIKDIDIAVAGSYIINSDNYYRQIENLLKYNKEENIEIKKELPTKQRIKYILYPALLPIIILLLYSIYSAIFGIDFFGSTYGINAVTVVLLAYGIEFWPLWLIDILIILFCLINLKNKKTSD